MCPSLRNIYIVGAQCTGKTTLVKALKDHFHKGDNFHERDGFRISRPSIVTEVARTVLEQHNFTADDITSSPARALALQQLILQAQLSAERAALEEGEWFISDRSGADPIVYARKYVGEDAASGLLGSAEWLVLGERMRQSLVIVCEAGADWLMDDGVRLMPEDRDGWTGFHQLFCGCLEDWDVSYEVLPCTVTGIDERVAFVVGRWKQS